MVDIETMGVTPTAPVLTIGAVLFDPQADDTFEQLRKRAFLRVIDIKDAVKHSTGVEPDTLKWWLSQTDTAIKRLITGDLISVKQALTDLYAYAQDRSACSPLGEQWRYLPLPQCYWANSPNFDMVILEASARSVGLPWPFFFSWYRDLRTIKDCAFPNGPDDVPRLNEGVAHDAADDAVAQALLVQECYRKLGLAPERAEFSP